MTKRTFKEITKDLERIKAASKMATSLSEMAEELGLSLAQIRITLNGHPTIKSRVMNALSENRSKVTQSIIEEPSTTCMEEVQEKSDHLIVVDTSAILNGFAVCSKFETVYVTKFVYSDLCKLQFRIDSFGNSLKLAIKARELIGYIDTHPNWLHVVDIEEANLLVQPNENVNHIRSYQVVAIACKMWTEYHRPVELKTCTGETFKLAKLQEVLDVEFVPYDNFRKIGIRDITRNSRSSNN